MGIAEIVEESDHIIQEKIQDIADIEEEKAIDSQMVKEPEVKETGIPINEKAAKEAFAAFAQNQTPSMAALIKMFSPKTVGDEIIVTMHKANMNLTEPIKISWQLFLRDYFNSNKLVLNLVEDDSVIEQTVAYTQREQLEELAKNNPLMRDLIKKLNLKLK